MTISLLLIVAPRQKTLAQDVVVSYQTFYDELSPYGQWVEDPEYGNVWVPNEAPGYRPYATGGHWAMTDYGNMWVSDAPYGWACYHYGRWTYNPYYGWVWLPGHEWAPAWVSWRSGGGYYGWAPMGPGAMPGGAYEYPDNYWVFVGPEYLYRPNVYTYYEPRYERRYMRQTTYINETYVDNGYHTTYYYGPRREVIERETHQPVQVYRVSNAGSYREARESGGVVQVYRPTINSQTQQTARPANSFRATQPIGRPQEISRNEGNAQPQFRQELTQRQNNNSGVAEPRNQQQVQQNNRPQPQHIQTPANNQSQPQQPVYNNRQPAAGPQTQFRQPQAQPQQPQPQNRQPQAQPQQPQRQPQRSQSGQKQKEEHKR